MSDSLERLYHAVIAAKDLDPATSRTARLFQRGPAKMAKKLAEEAIEVVIDAVNGNSDAVIRESADLLYNLSVLWVAAGVRPEDVWAEMDRRERVQGIAEKLPKASADKPHAAKPVSDKSGATSKAAAKIAPPSASESVARRPIVALQSSRLKKRR
ncbi:phosphoribosyl-ATP pyrophosphohydrolase [Afipia massiliensis]|uniref:Phosphoribosyl-ATP pyrophosphatase n=1 Tax=Afipia massiliensis TaxID=211460 RepID=A0A840N0X0_9BRAD|nr:phosphoribosyl-ATP diphosphatase [Afipia massiliensis]MBB5052602.1 phosphoribosyl-ATP pyrophosphohydrolase [Afipia massiliensis]